MTHHDPPWKRLSSSMGMQGLSLVSMAALQLGSVPILLGLWGKDVYGLWLVAVAATGLLSLCDFGLQGSFANMLRRAGATTDGQAFSRILDTGLGLYGVLLAALGCCLALGFILGLPPAIGLEAGIVAPMAVSIIVLLPRGLVATIYSARGRFARESGLGLVLQLGQSLAPIAAALAGGGVAEAAWLYLAASLVLGWGVLLWDVRARHPDLVLRPCLGTRAELRPLLAKAPLYALTNGLPALLMHAPVMVLGLISASALPVVAFTAMRTITGVVRQVFSMVSVATGVEMAGQHARGDLAGVRRVMTVAGYLAAILGGLAAGALLTLGPPAFQLWTRGRLAFDYDLALAFLLPMLINAPTCGAIGLLRHLDRPTPMARATSAQTALTLFLLYPLAAIFGPAGAAAALATGEILALGFFTLRDGASELGMAKWPFAFRCWGLALLAAGAGWGLSLLVRLVG